MAFIERLKFYKRKPTKLSGCTFFGLIIFGCTVLTCSLPWIVRSVEVLENRILWDNNGIDDYLLTIGVSGPGGWFPPLGETTITVQDGRAVAANSISSPDWEVPISLYQQVTVDRLFTEALGCVLFCQVSFDPQYGYPISIHHSGFIEGGSFINVTDFQPNG